MIRVLVSGGAGFIGSHIVDALIKDGNDAVVIDNLSTGKKENLNPKARFYKVDIKDKKVEDIFKKEKPDYVCHQAAHIDLRASVKDPIFDAENNIIGSLNILENCVKYGVKKVVFASTGGAIYGDANIIPTQESYPAYPVSPYGVSKLSVENYLHYYFKIFKLPYAALRYANVYGPRQDSKGEAGVIAIFTEKMLIGGEPLIFGNGRQTRDYIFAGDVARANILALKNKKIGCYNVGTGVETSVNQIFRNLVKLTKADVKEKHVEAAKGEQKRSCLDASKIKKDFGWKVGTNLEDGLKITVEWFKNHLSI
jgi:UDP-glucose 4-epimerase